MKAWKENTIEVIETVAGSSYAGGVKDLFKSFKKHGVVVQSTEELIDLIDQGGNTGGLSAENATAMKSIKWILEAYRLGFD